MTEVKKNRMPERRRFLKTLWITLGVVAGSEVFYLVYNFLRPSKKITAKKTQELFEAGNLDDFKKDTLTSFRNRNFFISRLKNGKLLAISTKCTHLGCVLNLDLKNNHLVCPCHSSLFDMEGKVLKSPAIRDLDLFEVIIVNNVVKVDTGVKIQRKKR